MRRGGDSQRCLNPDDSLALQINDVLQGALYPLNNDNDSDSVQIKEGSDWKKYF